MQGPNGGVGKTTLAISGSGHSIFRRGFISLHCGYSLNRQSVK